MIQIDGSFGEGGGQILRSCLTLSIITGKAFEIYNIRAHRKKPGLMAQHLKCVEAAAAITEAETWGVKIGSQNLCFRPKDFIPGEYRFEIGTAGSTSLVLQAIFLPLAMANQKSRIVIIGGTHVNWSPTYHYLIFQWLSYMRRLGFNANLKLVRAGFYPRGDGKIIAEIEPPNSLHPLELITRGNLLKVKGISAVANLDFSIAQRQRNQVEKRLKQFNYNCQIKIEQMCSRWKNTMMLLMAEFENGSGCFTALGARGKRAEKVADEAADELLEFLSSTGCIDKYLADQLILPLSIIKQKSIFSTSKITNHLLTNIKVVKKFLDLEIKVDGKLGQEGIVEILF